MKPDDPSAEIESAVSGLLRRGFEELSLDASDSVLSQLRDLVFLLSHWAQRINLTGHRGPEEMVERLILDAVALSAAVPELNRLDSLADLGSGAGFPGLPIAVLNPHLTVHLVDSRLKRNHFQKAARRTLGLENVRPVLGRSDEIEPVACAAVVAQAMTQPDQAINLMRQWARPGAWILLPASENAIPPENVPGVEQLERREYFVPGTGARRQLWLMRHRPTDVSSG